jgi:hypothetical protein
MAIKRVKVLSSGSEHPSLSVVGKGFILYQPFSFTDRIKFPMKKAKYKKIITKKITNIIVIEVLKR